MKALDGFRSFRSFRVLAAVALLAATSLLQAAEGAEVQVRIEQRMVANESAAGDPYVLFDEQGSPPPDGRPAGKSWSAGWKDVPLLATVDLGRERKVSAICLYDINGTGDFEVYSGSPPRGGSPPREGVPGNWLKLFTDDCVGYRRWKRHRVGVLTRYLRFVKVTGGANVSEVVIYEDPDADYGRKPIAVVEAEKRAREKATREAAIAKVLAARAALPRSADAGPVFGELPLVDEVRCGDPREAHPVKESAAGSSKVETVLGRACRVLPNTGGARYFAYRLGQRMGLEAGKAYVLAVEYPEDGPRTMFILNRGGEVGRGLHTGETIGDVLYTYTNNNAESLRVPLSGEYRTWTMLFYLHDRFPGIEGLRGGGARPFTPRDGFWVIVAQSKAANAPASAGAAVSCIRLFEVPEPARHDLELRPPPEGLPRRHVFWREEMADGVIHSRKESERGLVNDIDYYEHQARLMRFLGVDTFCKDLLEFGHNQGWDADLYGGNKWYWQSKTPKRWQSILAMLKKYDFSVLPYYEWAGSTGQNGVGKLRKCVTLGGNPPAGGKRAYTHITWSEKMNADVTDAETIADAKKLLDATIVRHKDRARFLGAWFRTRPSHIPISFSDGCLLRFAVEANDRKVALREDLRRDKALLARYYDWWFGKRREFLVALRDHLRERGLPEATVFFTPESAEPGPSLGKFEKFVVTDDTARWAELLAAPEHAKVKPYSFGEAVRSDAHLEATLSPKSTWGEWEWQHSVPWADPGRYAATPGVCVTYPMNRAYTVSGPAPFDAFRSPAGLAVVRHYPLNENVMEKKLGYFVCDVERAGPYCMLAEARAVAYGDPRYIGYLAAATFNRGFPEHVRAFNAAFLALPALPSRLLDGASTDPEVVVRAIPTEKHGTYLAVVNVGLARKTMTVELPADLPAAGEVTDAATGALLPVRDRELTFTLGPCELRAVHVE